MELLVGPMELRPEGAVLIVLHLPEGVLDPRLPPMVWTLIQRTVRSNLKKWNTGLPYHRNKPSDKITTRFFCALFPSV